MVSYEFTDEQNAVIASLNLRATLIGLINIIGAVALWMNYALTLQIHLLINGTIILVIALAFIIPMQDLVKVVKSEGTDIEELISGFRKLNIGWLVFIVGFGYLKVYEYVVLGS